MFRLAPAELLRNDRLFEQPRLPLTGGDELPQISGIIPDRRSDLAELRTASATTPRLQIFGRSAENFRRLFLIQKSFKHKNLPDQWLLWLYSIVRISRISLRNFSGIGKEST